MFNLGRFGWTKIGEKLIPYISRKINGEHIKFVSVRIAENHIFSEHFRVLHDDVLKCASVKSYNMTFSEVCLLNDIDKHYDGNGHGFNSADIDYIVRLEDVLEFSIFIKSCYNKIMCNVDPNYNNKCGLIRINFSLVLPYTVINGQQYLPVSCFEIKTAFLNTMVIENWSLAYLNFCFRVIGYCEKCIPNDLCVVSNIVNIKAIFPTGTNFEEIWPTKKIRHLLAYQKSTQTIPSSIWIKSPIVPANTIPRISIAPEISQSVPTGVIDDQLYHNQTKWYVFIYLLIYLIY